MSTNIIDRFAGASAPSHPSPLPLVNITGSNLRVAEVAQAARGQARVALQASAEQRLLIDRSRDFIRKAVESSTPIYGVTTGVGGMANVVVPREQAEEYQNTLPFSHKAGAGRPLPVADVRAAMILRANSLMRGVSGVRWELIQRLECFLQNDVTPEMFDLGSIGASGDLVPLAYVAGAITGLDASFKVDFQGVRMDCLTALKKLGLPRLRLAPKEALALMNGTSVSTGIAVNCLETTKTLLRVTFGVHALLLQALGATNQSFHGFIHEHKPHPGQIASAEAMLGLLADSRLIRNELNGCEGHRRNDLIQDRYSMRCLPQFLGPIVDGVKQVEKQLEVEINSATDNPLIDAETQTYFHCGNFLAQYVSIGMDQVRSYLGLAAKHLDAQIALLVSPEFNRGLPASLAGNPDSKVNVGLKALQLTANSIMPMICFYGAGIADRFPTHAEQFNQNVSSMGFAAANLTRESTHLYRQYLSTALIFGVQGVELKCRQVAGNYDAVHLLGKQSADLYRAVRLVLGQPASAEKPLIWNDVDQALDSHVAKIAADLAGDGIIAQSLEPLQSKLL